MHTGLGVSQPHQPPALLRTEMEAIARRHRGPVAGCGFSDSFVTDTSPRAAALHPPPTHTHPLPSYLLPVAGSKGEPGGSIHLQPSGATQVIKWMARLLWRAES